MFDWLLSPWTIGVVGLLLLPFVRRAVQGVEDVRGKVVYITGGSEGIGKAMAEDFVKRGADVVIMARTESKLQKAVDDLKQHATATSQKVGYTTIDVTDIASVEAAMKKATAEYGAPNILVTSAGKSYPGYFLEQDVSIFERTMTLNYMGNVNTIKTVAPIMIEHGGGRIMIIASAAGVCAFIGYSTYSPSKFALRGLADTLRSELNGFGIQVSICYPPDTDTPGFKEEMLTKPVETLACFPVDAYSPESVSSASINSFLRGDYHICSPDILQNLLVSNMSGVTPRSFYFAEVLLQPLICFVAYPFVLWFDFQARKYSHRTLNAGAKEISKKRD